MVKKGYKKKRQALRRQQEQEQRELENQNRIEQELKQIEHLQQLFKQQQPPPHITIDPIICKRVWSNIVLRRLICSKIGECIPISEENRIKLKRGYAAREIRQYKTELCNEEPPSGLTNQRFYECPVITADLFQYHYEYIHNQIKRSYERDDYVLVFISGNPRNVVDTWLFRRAFEYLKRTDPQSFMPHRLGDIWDNVIKSNNVELYNYVKTVLPMPFIRDIKQLVSRATKPFNPSPTIEYGVPAPPSNTKLLKSLLKDLKLIDPLETQWFTSCNYKNLVETGSIEIMETIDKYAGDYYRPTDATLMARAIETKQIESIRFLYKVCKIPISKVSMLQAAHFCDLSFIIALHDIDPGACRLYALFLHVMGTSFSNGSLRHSESKSEEWQDFKKEFYQLGKQLNYVDKKLQHQIDNKLPFRCIPKNIQQPQQHFKIFECNTSDSSIPTLSPFSFDNII
ncbi:hypothetical protein DFA_00184 [Cavenderia fasciculata]|uniref:Uncharacterized protein n=1 Tax=Cavenderia fasciculata TaxID=261658 RepID=F4PXU6_CACFS|nr:uncharacterized protein DFA_00184 [Cavenderia fasciculata]EGG19606.1 hypothetical protein DFA_00184 [Cavenderia fasciculata]|eukprot:XP_004357900.1 hypothetical protein DFA_00184 [Cavenderia fasciculata]